MSARFSNGQSRHRLKGNYMTIQEFEERIKLIDPRLKIVYKPERFTDIAAVGLEGFPYAICAIPAPEIYEERNPEFKDLGGNVHSTISETEAKIRGYLERIKDPEILDLEMTELDINGKEIKKYE